MNPIQQVIIDLKNGTKCEGILVNIDKERMVINLSNAKRTKTTEDGKIIEESFPTLEIAKEDIKEVKIVQFESSGEQQKKEPNQNSNLNAIPQNLQSNAQNNQNKLKTYDKTDSFFDALTPMTNKDAQYESIRYNDKNCETFDLPKNMNNSNFDNNSHFSNRRGQKRGNRGGYNRGGYQNYNNNYHQNNYQNFSSYPNFGNNGNFNNSNQGYRGGRGYNNNFSGQSFHQRRNQNFENQNYQYSNQFQKQAQMFAPNNNDMMTQNLEENSMSGFSNNPSNFSGMMPQNQFNNRNMGGFQRGRGQYNRGFGGNNFRGRGRGNNKNFTNRVPNPEFNSLNENNEYNDQLDDEYNMSIYDKPSSSEALNQKPRNFPLSVYNPIEQTKESGEKSIYDH